ncbi:hypothetical protein F4820DRAFT_460575 [Hypoxylon rubiginosum]|uniref:Uncharacterized protein n=1 Tax=Hypoxylon rubiginosum TaxID=110542 RepID=A0ACB9YSG5_9PEZI|nr:hypothetical protein F4820DRAFT_460575 [Hypoxylon rubiginosum]
MNGNYAKPQGESDEIYPVHFIDQAAIIRSSIMSYSFRYNHVLDAQKLRDSLVMLLSSGDWRKLAGRLRKNKDGKLEIHVPRHFTCHRPPIRFSHVEFHTKLDAHPLANRLPKKTGNKPSIHDGCNVFREFSVPSAFPSNINHYLSTDEPLICLHINSFTDGTVVSLTIPHSLTDAMGMADLLQAWTRVFREQNIESLEAQLEGAREDIITSVGTADDKTARDTKFVLEERQTTGLSLLAFMARHVVDTLTYRSIETHHIYLPATFLSYLRQQAEKESRVENGDENESLPFVSDGDLIAAWGSRMVLSSRPTNGTAVICNVFDVRRRLDFLESSPSSRSRAAVYLQNLILPSTTLLTAKEASSLSVYQIASRVRKAIVEQTSDAQVRSLMRIARTWFASLGTMPLFASWDTTRVIGCTNWAKARFLDRADFRPAAITAQEKTSADETKPIEFWGTTPRTNTNTRDAFIIYGKDHEGDYWVNAYLRKETWHLVKTELDQFAANFT